MLNRTDRTRVVRAVGLVAVVGLVSAACSIDVDAVEANCDELRAGRAERVVLVLADQRSVALDRTMDMVENDPEAVFSSQALGGATDKVGIVVLATYDHTGSVTTHVAANLAGIGRNRGERRTNAIAQRECLSRGYESLAASPAESRGDLLRALPSAMVTASSYTEPDGAALVVAAGFGRLESSGLVVAEADLTTDEARAAVLDQLVAFDLLPHHDGNVALHLLSVGEGVGNAIQAAGVGRFAEQLCELIPNPCTTSEALP